MFSGNSSSAYLENKPYYLILLVLEQLYIYLLIYFFSEFKRTIQVFHISFVKLLFCKLRH